MKKFLSLALALVLCLALFAGCAKKQEEYNYSLNTFIASVWGGQELEDVTVDEESCSLSFDPKEMKITFTCDGQTFSGSLTDKRSQESVDMYKLAWDSDPAGTDEYEFSYSAFICNNDYDEASPFVFLMFYFDGEKDSIEAAFSMKYNEE